MTAQEFTWWLSDFVADKQNLSEEQLTQLRQHLEATLTHRPPLAEVIQSLFKTNGHGSSRS